MNYLLSVTFLLIIGQNLVLGQPWVPRPGTWPDIISWYLTHLSFISVGQNNHEQINVVFYGDSLMQGWDPEIWTHEFDKYGSVNFGINGDKVENNLFRMVNGELDPLHPEMLVIMIGGNNLLSEPHTNDEIVYGIFTILQTLNERLPNTKILLLGMIPSNMGPEYWDRKLAINNDLAFMANNQTVYYLGMWDEFLEGSPGYGYVDLDIYPDGIHLSKRGYQIYADALRPTFEYVWAQSPPSERK